MDKDKKAYCRLGDFEEERKKIVEEYAKGNYYKTSADIAMEKEKKEKKKKKKK
ncbi:MAG TPA: hypothetical protein PL110_14370 [Candidatus Eremiobacteraeota bacterium]|nr:MAG: hypothetical protein BWY64_01101 [bacterium ADurb.Bin363]HPZ09290.1 hypothetical protein [Candidatus Eremiobacteraeota bacterium]